LGPESRLRARGIHAKNPRIMKCSVRRWAVLMSCTLALGGAAPAAAQTEYTADGVPTGLEEEIRWRVNRGRFDSVSENQYRGTNYADVAATASPLAPNQSLTLASRHHSEDMARNNTFQHATVTGSAYYDPIAQPTPWDRMTAEGYVRTSAAENISAGYTSAEAAYVGWWNSEDHRHNMYNTALREIGNGYYYWSVSTYHRYYTMDLGSSGANYFFTDTLFLDANVNGVYDEAEAVSGVAIRLLVGGAPASYYDVSSAAGSFAIPIGAISPGSTVQVVFSNTTATTLALTIPVDYWTNRALTLGPGQSSVWGTFTTGATWAERCNVGLRNVTPLPPIAAPILNLSRVGTDMLLSWASETGLQYRLQWAANFQVWRNLTVNPLPGTGTELFHRDIGAAALDLRFYRLLVTRP